VRLEGKVAIVTGAAQGIGFASAERFAQEGAKVVLVDILSGLGESASERLNQNGYQTHFRKCDVTQADQIEKVISETEDRFGSPSILMNNAAIYRAIDFLKMTEDQFNEVIRINLNSVFLFTQAVSRRLVEKGMHGSIVNVSSVNARMSSGLATAYSASKGGISAFTAAACLALAEHGIRINAIAPGTINTELASGIARQPDIFEDTLRRIPIGRLGDPSEIAALACFLASDDASYLTGQTIFADGGRNALSIVMPRRKS
jgi:glucose 1-dehydrogenase